MNIKRACVNVLTNILGNNQWYEGKVDLAYLGGRVLVKKLPDLTGAEPPKEAEEVKGWLDEEFDVDLTDKEINATKQCLEFSLKKSALPLNTYTFELMNLFGVDDPDPTTEEVIKRCKKDPAYFIDHFCKIKHPNAGIIPFQLFSYQRNCLKDFKENRFNIFSKTRQSGISTLCGAYALWLAMFFKTKTVLIVSKRDKDAMEFMGRNIKFVYNHLPKWMQAIWKPVTNNEHEIGFSNGSKITSLPSGPDTLRSNSSSLNIIDEAAFCPHMNDMWAGGYPTLQHGGSVVVVSTSNGIGDWYWKTWTDAQDSNNEFNPIKIDWWEMDWVIEYDDDISHKPIRIAPADNTRKCTTKDEIAKYGEYWSPWLETQYRQLTEKGNDAKFRQEVLRDFLGSGNSVLSRDTLLMMRSQAKEAGQSYKTVNHVD